MSMPDSLRPDQIGPTITVRPHALIIMDVDHVLGQVNPSKSRQTTEYVDAQNHMWNAHFRRSNHLRAVRFKRRLPTPGSNWHLCPAR